MITFREFLAEAERHPDAVALDEAVAKIKADCGPFLKATSGKFPMFRGFVKAIHGLTEKAIRQDRQPRDTNRDAHLAMDEWFYKEFSIKPRAQGLFCTGDPGLAEKFKGPDGSVCLIFPIGEFEYLWAKNDRGAPVTDSGVITGSIEMTIDLNHDESPEAKALLVAKKMEKFDWQHNHGIQTALLNNGEVVIIGGRYYAMPLNMVNWHDYPKVFG